MMEPRARDARNWAMLQFTEALKALWASMGSNSADREYGPVALGEKCREAFETLLTACLGDEK